VCPPLFQNFWIRLNDVLFLFHTEVLIKRCEQTTTREVEDNIIRTVHLKGQMWSEHAFGQQPIVVFCVVSSRIGTDIDSAMRGVNGEYISTHLQRYRHLVITLYLPARFSKYQIVRSLN